jgi:hypothetical protein
MKNKEVNNDVRDKEWSFVVSAVNCRFESNRTVLDSLSRETAVFWYMTSCRFLHTSMYKNTLDYPDVVGSNFLRNVHTYRPIFTASCLRGLRSSTLLLH